MIFFFILRIIVILINIYGVYLDINQKFSLIVDIYLLKKYIEVLLDEKINIINK